MSRQCGTCKKSLAHSSSYRRHVSDAHRVRSVCPYCGRQMKRRHKMKDHLNKYHGIKDENKFEQIWQVILRNDGTQHQHQLPNYAPTSDHQDLGQPPANLGDHQILYNEQQIEAYKRGQAYGALPESGDGGAGTESNGESWAVGYSPQQLMSVNNSITSRVTISPILVTQENVKNGMGHDLHSGL